MTFIRKYFKLILLFSVVVLVLTAFFSDITLRIFFRDKVWAHKVNYIGKLADVKKHFTGVELDIVFEKSLRDFEVYHPPESANGLTLTKYFASQKNNNDVKYWFDFKNLSAENELIAASILDSLLRIYNFPNSSVIVESPEAKYLKQFSDKGFNTSYYLPTNLYEQNQEALNSLLSGIKQTEDLYPTTYVSFEYRDYRIIKKHFPNSKKLCWYTIYGSMNKFKARTILFELLMDKQVDVLLIPFEWEEK